MSSICMAFIILLIVTFNTYHLIAQSSASLSSESVKCQNEQVTLDAKRNEIESEYNQVVSELKQGLFCSQCNRSKSQIEKTEAFGVHLKNVKGTAVAAPQAAYDQAHRDYTQKFNNWKSKVESKKKECQQLQSQLATAQQRENQALIDKQKQQQLDFQARQQQAIDDANRVKEQVASELAATIKKQEEVSFQNRLAQQQQFSQSVNNYSAAQLAENDNRRQAIDKIGEAGNQLAQSITNKAIDLEKLQPQNLSGSAVFKDAISYEDILKNEEEASKSQTLISALNQHLTDAVGSIKASISSRIEKINSFLPACIKCTWQTGMISSITAPYIEHVVEETSLAVIEDQSPRLGHLFGSVYAVAPVYDISESVNNLVDIEAKVIDNLMSGTSTPDDEIMLEQGIVNVKDAVFSNLPGFSGRLYQVNQAFKSWFDCSNQNQ